LLEVSSNEQQTADNPDVTPFTLTLTFTAARRLPPFYEPEAVSSEHLNP